MAESSTFKDTREDAFKDRLSQRARDTTRPALAHQSRGRAFTDEEQALANAMMEILGGGVSDFAVVAEELSRRGVRAPISGGLEWSLDLLRSELSKLNEEFDTAYQRSGFGA